jgi:hypothetical protein
MTTPPINYYGWAVGVATNTEDDNDLRVFIHMDGTGLYLPVAEAEQLARHVLLVVSELMEKQT